MRITRPKRGSLFILAASSLLNLAGCPNDSGHIIPPIVPAPEEVELQVTVIGSGVVDPDGGTFNAGESVELTAEPKAGWRLVRWEGDVAGRDEEKNPLTIQMDADRTLTAVFTQQFELTVDIQGKGDVLLETADGTGTTESLFDDGTELTLTPEPKEGWTFLQWEGNVSARHEEDNPLTITIDDDLVITAVFVREYVLTIEIEGEGEVDPRGGAFADGFHVTLTATADDGYFFARWTGDVDADRETDNPLEMEIEDDCELTAVFLKVAIVAGEAIGPIRLGDTWREVTALLGAPDRTYASSSYWWMFFQYDALGIHGCLDDIDRDEQIDAFEIVSDLWAYDPFPGTFKGAGIGSSKNDVIKVMGPPEEIIRSEYWYGSRGIMWDFEGNRVDRIYVFEPY